MSEGDFSPIPLTDDERLALASDWSDYRKDYGTSSNDDRLRADHQVFGLAWRAGRDYAARQVQESRARYGDLEARVRAFVEAETLDDAVQARVELRDILGY